MAIKLRIVCYNIAEGNRYHLPRNNNLPALADQIRGKSPDIVLLNEARIDNGWPFGSAVNQFKRLSELTGLAYYGSGNTTATGLTGHKAVGILSRFPLLTERVIPVMRGSSPTTYATFEATVEIAGSIHYIFATRFDHLRPEDREAGIRQAAAIIQTIDVNRPVIFGGDFNTGPGQADFDVFPRDTGLKLAFAERPDPHFGGLDHIDHIFYRGPYRVTQVEHRCVIEVPNNPNNRECDDASDHPSVFVELTTPLDDARAIYKSTIKLKHFRSAGTLHSHLINYGHPGSSGQQQVTAFGGSDGNDFWRLHGPHDSPREYGENQPIRDGEVIRLEHVATGCNLHSHDGHPSPVTGQQEVTCFGQNAIGDENDNWRVEVEGGGIWTFDKRVKLIHVATNHALHSHAGFAHRDWTMGQQEVTCFADRDDNDWWYLTEVNEATKEPVAQGNLLRPGEALNAGQSIVSENGRYTFIYQGDGNLVLYRDGTWLWDSATGQPVGVCIMQGDGNLVIYGPGEQYVWDTATHGNPGSLLVVQDDGNVVIYRPDGTPVWATNTWQ